jgi:hypothetical protein
MYRSILVILLGAAGVCSAGAIKFPVDLEQELHGLDIAVTATPGALTVVTLQNRSSERVDCNASFEGGLATPQRKATRIAPGKTATLSYKARDDIARLRVNLDCDRAKADK